MTAGAASVEEDQVGEPFVTRVLGWVLLVGGAMGLVSSFALVLDKLSVLGDPSFVPSCSINEVVSCGAVLTSEQAELFGFPNPLIGVAAYPVLITLGVLRLAGVRPPAWIDHGLQVGATLGLVFVLWLMSQSLYVIGALCPWCMAAWAATISVFWYTTLHNLTRTRIALTPPVRFAILYHGAVLAVVLLGVTTLILLRFRPS